MIVSETCANKGRKDSWSTRKRQLLYARREGLGLQEGRGGRRGRYGGRWPEFNGIG